MTCSVCSQTGNILLRLNPMDTLKERRDLPDGDDTLAGELAERELHEEERDSREHQHHHVRDQKRACNPTHNVKHVETPGFCKDRYTLGNGDAKHDSSVCGCTVLFLSLSLERGRKWTKPTQISNEIAFSKV